jgi:hypothetical protein
MAFELYDLAERMMRQNLRRRDPRATEEEIEWRLRAWLRSAPPPGTCGPGPALRPGRRDLG